MKKMTVFLLVLILLCSGCTPYSDTVHIQAYAYVFRSMPPQKSVHADVRFSDIPFQMPALNDLLYRAEALYESVCSQTDSHENAKDLQDELDRLWAELKTAETMRALAYIHYSRDVTDPVWSERNEILSASIEPIYATLVQIALHLSEQPALRSVYDANTVAELRKAVLLTSTETAPLLKQEQAILSEYDQLHATLTVEGEGRTWTYNELTKDETLPFASWYALYTAYTEQYANAAAELFCRLLPLRRETARLLGFASYPAYRYAVYGRECTTQDAEHFCDTVASHLVPLFLQWQKEVAVDREILYYADTYDRETTVQRVGQTISEILPSLAEPWQYMLAHELYDAGSGPHRLGGSYTTYLSDYSAPFLFTAWDDSASMPSVLLHEFGHFAGYYFRAENNNVANDSLDWAEFDSQGLELLAVPYYEKIFGNRADEARSVRLLDTLYAVVSACAVDEWERFVYQTDNLTPAALHAKFGQIAERFGLDRMGFTAYSWTEIPHIFQSPCYYLSYGAGAAAALLLYQMATENLPKAALSYQKLLLRSYGTNFGESLHRVGLTDPYADDTINNICKLLYIVY